MTYSNDPQEDKEQNYINKPDSLSNLESQKDADEIHEHSHNVPHDPSYEHRREPRYLAPTPEEEEEAERLLREERKAAKARKLVISRKANQSISYLVTALEILLGLRFLLMVTGANRENIFSSFIYGLSKPFAIPFSNLFDTITFNNETNVLDINIIFAMIIYLLLMLLVNWLIQIIIKP
ncbi:MAG: YggT family protein [Cyanobacteria bacterium SW_9_44_58]|nr:MAG: YggT family protein [Cyanobacteria bacterium SW_9_44_58]